MKNTVIIIFGATGDLSKRKLIPALYRFVKKNKLENVIIIGAALDDIQAAQMLDSARTFIQDVKEDYWRILQNHTYYKKVDFKEKEDFVALQSFVEECEQKHSIKNGNRLFYLSVAAQFFCPITSIISDIGLIKCQSD